MFEFKPQFALGSAGALLQGRRRGAILMLIDTPAATATTHSGEGQTRRVGGDGRDL